MTKQEWIDEFARIIQERGVSAEYSYEIAESNYEYSFDMTPAEAVESELSYWGD